ncbi:MAG: porin family protein [Candidatus Brocadiales bacterium]|nr:porin family protein [Candidatus Bathyanammoxibius sp.]
MLLPLFRVKIFTVALRIGALVLLTTCCYQPATAQGLLGERYVDATFGMSRPSDDALRQISSWAVGGGLSLNVPLQDRLDLEISTNIMSFDGTAVLPGPMLVGFDSDLFEIGTSLNWHFRPGCRIDPFIGAGVGYQSQKLEVTNGFVVVRANSDEIIYRLKAGFEITLTEQIAVRTSVSTGDAFDDASFKSAVSDNVFLSSDLIWWIDDSWFTRLGIGSNFDDTDVQLEFSLGRRF